MNRWMISLAAVVALLFGLQTAWAAEGGRATSDGPPYFSVALMDGTQVKQSHGNGLSELHLLHRAYYANIVAVAQNVPDERLQAVADKWNGSEWSAAGASWENASFGNYQGTRSSATGRLKSGTPIWITSCTFHVGEVSFIARFATTAQNLAQTIANKLVGAQLATIQVRGGMGLRGVKFPKTRGKVVLPTPKIHKAFE